MDLKPEYIDAFIPFGESLKTLLRFSSITKSDIRGLLKFKGIYVSEAEYEIMFPLLTTTLLTPGEFDYIKERLKTKEDKEKVSSKTIPWNSSETLIAAIPDNLHLNDLVNLDYSKYQVLGNPTFAQVESNPDMIRLQYEVQRTDFGSNWFQTDSKFKGEVTLEKVQSGNKIELRIVHTAPETKRIADNLSKKLIRKFKETNHVPTAAPITEIRFDSFSNQDRIRFFWSLTGESGSDLFDFQKIVNLDFGPDSQESLPSEISWLEVGRVKKLVMGGDALHSTFFVTERQFWPFFIFVELEAEYRFSYHAAEGTCKVRFGFPRYLQSQNSSTEFEVNVSKVTLDSDYRTVNKKNVEKHLLLEFQKLKMEKYRWHEAQTASLQHTPPTTPN